MDRPSEAKFARAPRPAAFCLVLAALAGAAFVAYPALDLFFAGLFHDPQRGFPAEADATVQAVRRLWHLSAWLLVIGAGVLLVASALLGRKRLLGIGRAALVFFLLVQGFGPGLLANAVFKDHWGRARPSQVAEFGGMKRHTPPLLPTDQCARNCSFVGGEAAYGFSFMALGFLPAPAWRRRAWFAFGAAFGGAISLVRVAQGGHFVSDCLFAALLMLLVGWAVHALLFRARLPAPIASWLGIQG